MPSEIDFSQIGDQQQPSPSVWADCPRTLLNDKGLGYYGKEDFLGNVEVASFADKSVFGTGEFGMDGDTGALAPLTGTKGGYGSIATGATDNDAITLFSAPLGSIVRNSGNKFWAETNLQFAALGDEALFFGLTTEANGTRDVIADNPSNSAVAGLTSATFVGFVTVQASSAIATVNVVYEKTTGTPVTVSSNVTNATAIPLASRASLAATTDVKFGLRFDGKKTLYFYVNGYKVATQEVDSTVDQSGKLAVVLNIKSGSASAKTVSVDWVQYAFQSRY